MGLSPRLRVLPSPMFLAELASSHPVSRRKVSLYSCLSEAPGKRFGLAPVFTLALPKPSNSSSLFRPQFPSEVRSAWAWSLISLWELNCFPLPVR